MSDSRILNSIDEVIAAVESCGCGCGQRITDRSASPFYASEACQTKWMERGKDLKLFGSSRRPRYASLPINLEPTIRPRPSWPDGPSVYDLMADIVTWFNANGIPAIDVPVAEVAQLHDGQITVWTFERPRRFISEAEGAARTLITVPMVASPPDVLQPWLRGECRESVPFISADTAEVDAVLRHVATRDRPAEEQRMEVLVRDLPRGTMQFSGHFVGDIVITRLGGVADPRVQIDRADPYAFMSVELFEAADPELLRVRGEVLSLGTAGLGLGVVHYRIVQRDEAMGTLLLKRLCCDLHGRNCEQGGEECCDDCTERLHFAANHGGLECSAPDLSAGTPVQIAVDVGRDGTGAVAVQDSNGLRIVERHHITPRELEAAVRVAADDEARRVWRREVLGEWPVDAQPEPRARPADAAREPSHDGPVRRRRWWFW